MSLILLTTLNLWAATSSEVSEDAMEKARNRDFPGGVDESRLKVQDPLPTPLKKVNPKLIQKQIYKTLFEEEMKDESPSINDPMEGNPSDEESETTEG